MKSYLIFSTIIFFIPGMSLAKWREGDPFATAKLLPKSGSQVTGTIDFAKTNGKLIVKVYAKNIAPGAHGIHIHEKGNCSDGKAENANGHYNPFGNMHGGRDSRERHVGDFGNIIIPKGEISSIRLEIKDPMGKNFDWSRIIGKAIIIHAKADDFVSQPSGNSGKRIACGVIEGTKPVTD